MARICSCTFLLLSLLLVTSFSTSQLAASVCIQTDVARDLEQIKSFHDAKLQFASQFEAELLFQTDCQFYDCVRLCEDQHQHEHSSAAERTVRYAGSDLSNSDVPPAPRNDVEPEPKQAETDSDELVVESSLCDVEPEFCDVTRHHRQLLNRRPVWEVTSRFLAAQKTRLIEAVRFATISGEGICYWVNKRIESVEGHIVTDKRKQSSTELQREVAEQESSVESLERSVSLEPVATTSIPMFLVSDIETDASAGDSAVAEANGSNEEPQLSEVSAGLDAEPNGLSNKVIEPASLFLPEDVFINENNSSTRSIELEQSDRDPYWQYYDDCDRWGVNFAKLIFEAQLDQPVASDGNLSRSANTSAFVAPLLMGHGLTAIANLNWLSLAIGQEAVSEPLQRLWQEMLDQSEFSIFEEQRNQVISFRTQPLSPCAAAAPIRNPFCDRYGVNSEDLTLMLDADLLGCYICEIQFQYADQIRQLADLLNRFADSISQDSSDVAVVAGNGKSTATK